MPLLRAEPALFPPQLFSGETPQTETADRVWWVLHTRPRQEKSIARELLHREIPFYLPLSSHRLRCRGRNLTSHLPLFPGYVFLFAAREERLAALTTSRVVRTLAVSDQDRLWRDLRQIHRLIATKAPLTLVGALTPGMAVEITSGPLAGLTGKILRGASGCRFVVEVNFIQQGASVLLEETTLAPLT
jgi:transcriptional antiterminator RfaH